MKFLCVACDEAMQFVEAGEPPRGDTLTAATRGSSRQASAIGPGNSADLQLTLDSQAEPDRLTGILRLAGCEAALQFASRRAAAPPGLR